MVSQRRFSAIFKEDTTIIHSNEKFAVSRCRNLSCDKTSLKSPFFTNKPKYVVISDTTSAVGSGKTYQGVQFGRFPTNSQFFKRF